MYVCVCVHIYLMWLHVEHVTGTLCDKEASAHVVPVWLCLAHVSVP